MLDRRGLIKKANITFSFKFLEMLVCHNLSPTTVDNILTWDRAVIVAALIHERDFKTFTTYPFACMNFLLCGDDGVPLW